MDKIESLLTDIKYLLVLLCVFVFSLIVIATVAARDIHFLRIQDEVNQYYIKDIDKCINEMRK